MCDTSGIRVGLHSSCVIFSKVKGVRTQMQSFVPLCNSCILPAHAIQDIGIEHISRRLRVTIMMKAQCLRIEVCSSGSKIVQASAMSTTTSQMDTHAHARARTRAIDLHTAVRGGVDSSPRVSSRLSLSGHPHPAIMFSPCSEGVVRGHRCIMLQTCM